MNATFRFWSLHEQEGECQSFILSLLYTFERICLILLKTVHAYTLIITLHDIAIHYITLHYIKLHYTTHSTCIHIRCIANGRVMNLQIMTTDPQEFTAPLILQIPQHCAFLNTFSFPPNFSLAQKPETSFLVHFIHMSSSTAHFHPRRFPTSFPGQGFWETLTIEVNWMTHYAITGITSESPERIQKKTHTDFSCCLLIGAFVWQLYVTWYYVYICWLFYMNHYINWLVGFCPWTLGSSIMGPNIFTAHVNKLSSYKEHQRT